MKANITFHKREPFVNWRSKSAINSKRAKIHKSNQEGNGKAQVGCEARLE